MSEVRETFPKKDECTVSAKPKDEPFVADEDLHAWMYDAECAAQRYRETLL